MVGCSRLKHLYSLLLYFKYDKELFLNLGKDEGLGLLTDVSVFFFISTLFFLLNSKIVMPVVSACMWSICFPGALGGQEKVSEPLELELKMVVSCHLDLELTLFKERSILC